MPSKTRRKPENPSQNQPSCKRAPVGRVKRIKGLRDPFDVPAKFGGAAYVAHAKLGDASVILARRETGGHFVFMIHRSGMREIRDDLEAQDASAIAAFIRYLKKESIKYRSVITSVGGNKSPG